MGRRTPRNDKIRKVLVQGPTTSPRKVPSAVGPIEHFSEPLARAFDHPVVDAVRGPEVSPRAEPHTLYDRAIFCSRLFATVNHVMERRDDERIDTIKFVVSKQLHKCFGRYELVVDLGFKVLDAAHNAGRDRPESFVVVREREVGNYKVTAGVQRVSDIVGRAVDITCFMPGNVDEN